MTELKEKDACCPKDKKMEVEENKKDERLQGTGRGDCESGIDL